MFPNTDKIKGIAITKAILCIIEGLKICLYNNDSKFYQDHLLQTKWTATAASNSCSYSDLAIHRLDKLINNE